MRSDLNLKDYVLQQLQNQEYDTLLMCIVYTDFLIVCIEKPREHNETLRNISTRLLPLKPPFPIIK